MAENWNDYGDYGEEERYRKSSLLGKIFSFKTFKRVLKYFVILLLLSVYVLLAFRLCSNGPSPNMRKLLKTENNVAAYEKYGKLSVFSQELDAFITGDGSFAVYDVRLIYETSEIQFTVRYNNSIAEALRDKIASKYAFDSKMFLSEYKKANGLEDVSGDEVSSMTEYELALAEAMKASEEKQKAELEKVTETPFVFALRDEDGNVYTSYACAEYSKTVYKYLRVSFVVPGLFKSSGIAPELLYPSQDCENPLYIYKGAGAGLDGEELINTLRLEMFYENDIEGGNFGDTLTVYRAQKSVSVYNYKSEMKGGVTENIKYIDFSLEEN